MGMVYHAPLVRKTIEYGSPMEDVSAVAQMCAKRQRTDPPWPGSGGNDRPALSAQHGSVESKVTQSRAWTASLSEIEPGTTDDLPKIEQLLEE
ncbi:hypothetical protein Y032_0780g2300 [Ancylostoma ceylanicum]|nr:hypothetical protein Y032_0780g2300 [Ancylostoma ceylanicum]